MFRIKIGKIFTSKQKTTLIVYSTDFNIKFFVDCNKAFAHTDDEVHVETGKIKTTTRGSDESSS